MFEFKKTSKAQKRKMYLRIGVAASLVLVCFGLLIARLWFLQVERYEGFSARADANRIAVLPIPPRRGEILDRNGVVLARNYRDYTLVVTPAKVKNLEQLLDDVAELVELSPNQRKRFLQQVQQSSRYAQIPLRNSLNETEAAWFAANAYRFDGVELSARWVREYPYGKTTAHVIGYVGRISEADLERLEEQDQIGNYRGTLTIGKKGIEKTWESVLHGKTGLEEVEVTAKGRPVRTLRRIDPVPGSDLVLSLDIKLQQLVEQEYEGRRGALVAIDPKTGEILAFVSAPSFNPNLFIDGIDIDSWRELNESPDFPLLNRPLHSTYPIGSTYKPFVALAALEMGIRSASQRISDPGFYEFGGQKFRNAGSVAYGPTDMHRALVVSSDTYFYSLGPEMGVNGLHDFSRQFGFGQLTGIDLDGEKKGILPSTDWKQKAFRKPEHQRWYAGETVSVAVGQGYNAFTLLQLAQATAVLANGGAYMRPHLVDVIRNAQTGVYEKTVTEPSHVVPLKPENVAVINRALVGVINEGTARRAFAGANYQAAGKTGTAQVYSLRGAKYIANAVDERLRDHSLFMAYAPAENPKIALALIVENGGWGSTVAAPLARKVFDYWLGDGKASSSGRPGP